jgi:hypothetical protein
MGCAAHVPSFWGYLRDSGEDEYPVSYLSQGRQHRRPDQPTSCLLRRDLPELVADRDRAGVGSRRSRRRLAWSRDAKGCGPRRRVRQPADQLDMVVHRRGPARHRSCVHLHPVDLTRRVISLDTVSQRATLDIGLVGFGGQERKRPSGRFPNSAPSARKWFGSLRWQRNERMFV